MMPIIAGRATYLISLFVMDSIFDPKTHLHSQNESIFGGGNLFGLKMLAAFHGFLSGYFSI